MIRINNKGNFSKTETYLNRVSSIRYEDILKRYGQEGVSALASATPKDSGKTAQSWSYRITQYDGGAKISWHNSNVSDGIPVAILIQYGHATKDGSYIQGYDFINPAIRPIFDKIAQNLWKEVSR